jgi:redox-sensitive bicupin YhaK (pirin superfamily)
MSKLAPTLEALPCRLTDLGGRRDTAPGFEQRATLPAVALDGGGATLIMGELGGVRSPAQAFSPMVGAELSAAPGCRLVVPLDPGFEHAIVPLEGSTAYDARASTRRLSSPVRCRAPDPDIRLTMVVARQRTSSDEV